MKKIFVIPMMLVLLSLAAVSPAHAAVSAAPPVIISPTEGEPLAENSVVVQWSLAEGQKQSAFQVIAVDEATGIEIYNSGVIISEESTFQTDFIKAAGPFAIKVKIMSGKVWGPESSPIKLMPKLGIRTELDRYSLYTNNQTPVITGTMYSGSAALLGEGLFKVGEYDAPFFLEPQDGTFDSPVEKILIRLFPFTEDGSYRLWVQGADQNGLTETPPVEKLIYYDSEPPEAVIKKFSGFNKADNIILTGAFSDSVTFLGRVGFRIENKVDSYTAVNDVSALMQQGLEQEFTPIGIKDGEYMLSVYADDLAGNEGISVKERIIIDSSAPSADISRDDLMITIMVSDSGSGVKSVKAAVSSGQEPLRPSDGAYGGASEKFELNRAKYGNSLKKIITEDYAGNTGEYEVKFIN